MRLKILVVSCLVRQPDQLVSRFTKKNQPKKKSDTIVYYAPKTYIKSNVIEGVSIDGTDLKYLPREECKKPTSKIWKIAMWGGIGDINLIQKTKCFRMS